VTHIVKIIVAGKPVAKGRVRFTGHGRAFTPERTVAYESMVALAAQTAMEGRPPVSGPVAVRLVAYLPIAKSWPRRRYFLSEINLLRPIGKPDLDNIAKIIDALNHIVWNDDSQVVDMELHKYFDQTPRLEITVDALPQAVQ
jgi:Holliday junction resolvase RusA-like endonuclease